MSLKQIIRFHAEDIKLSDNICFITIEIDKEKIFLKKLFIKKAIIQILNKLLASKEDISPNKIRKYFPNIKEVKYQVGISELNKLAYYLNISFNNEEYNNVLSVLSVFKDALKDTAVIRGYIGFRFKKLKIFTTLKETYEKFEAKNVNIKENIYSFDDTLLGNKGIYKLRLFNVGQACCSAILMDNVPRFIFDLGCARHNRNLNNFLNKCDNVNVIISHFHNDHINNAKKLLCNHDKKINIFYPSYNEYDNLCINAKLLILLGDVTNINFVPLSLNSEDVLNVDMVNIYQGIGNKDNYKDLNSTCLISYVETPCNKVLIPGDALYEYFPIRFKPTFLIVPHHACDYDEKSNGLQNIDISNLKKSFVFAKLNKGYYHPNIRHLNCLKNNKKQEFYRLVSKSKDEIFIGKNIAELKEDYTSKSYDDYIDFIISSIDLDLIRK